jgi:REP element-mobilizing transposase RayT
MPRPPRPLIAGGTYHVTARGNRRQAIFRDDHDRLSFLARLARSSNARRWRVLAWCLLGNHYHLLLRTPDPDLDQGLRDVHGGYAQWFNRRHGVDGHLFQGRYGASMVLRDAHLLATIRYIALNPVEAGLAANPAAWRWSSHAQVLRADTTPLVAAADVLELFGADAAAAVPRYAEFIGDDGDRGSLPAPLPPLLNQPDLRQLAARIGDGQAVAAAYDLLGLSMPRIASELGCHTSTVSRHLSGHARGGVQRV